MVPCCHKGEPFGGYRVDAPICGKPAVQFLLHHSNTTEGVTWTSAHCQEHYIPEEPPPGIVWIDNAQDLTEDEYHVAEIMNL
jgi:hypothetical protein